MQSEDPFDLPVCEGIDGDFEEVGLNCKQFLRVEECEFVRFRGRSELESCVWDNEGNVLVVEFNCECSIFIFTLDGHAEDDVLEGAEERVRKFSGKPVA